MGIQLFLERTMVVERVCGVLVYCLVLSFICNGISISRPSSTRRWLIAYIGILSLMALLFVPPETADLTRLCKTMRDWSSHDVSWVIAQSLESATPAVYWYFWLIGQLHFDALLPCITCAIFYSLLFSCYWDYARRASVSPRNVALGIALVMSLGNFVGVISGIRYSLAAAFLIRAVYLELFAKKRLFFNAPYYVLAATFHSVGVALVLIRFLFFAIQRGNGRRSRFFRIILAVVLITLIVSIIPSIVIDMLKKAELYFLDNVYSDLFNGISLFVADVFILHSFFLAKRETRESEFEDGATNVNWAGFMALLGLISIVALPVEFSTFVRFGTISMMLVPIVAMNLLQRRPDFRNDGYRHLAWATTFILLLVACTRGALSSYKFFLIQEMG